MLQTSGWLRDAHDRQVLKSLGKQRGIHAAPFDPVLEFRELHAPDRGLRLGEAVISTELSCTQRNPGP